MPSSTEEDPTGPAADARRPSRTPRARSIARFAAVVLVGLVGGAIGALVAGQVSVPTEVGDVELSVRPAARGAVALDVAPLGDVSAPSLRVPARVTARLVALRKDFVVRAGEQFAAKQQVVSPADADRATEQIEDAVPQLVVRILAGALVGGALAALLVFRAWRPTLAGAAVALVAAGLFVAVAAATRDDDAWKEPETHGALSLLPHVAPAFTDEVDGAQDYAAKVFRNLEGLYTGYVRSVAAERIARTSHRVVVVSGDLGDDEARRQAGVLTTSQGAVALVWIATGSSGTAGEPEFDVPGGVPVVVVAADGPAAPAGALSGVTTVGSGTARAGPLTVQVVGPDGPVGPSPSTRADIGVSASGRPAGSLRLPVAWTGDEPSATGGELTDDGAPPRITTGTSGSGELHAAVMSLGRRDATLSQVDLVSVVEGEVGVQRVLR